ncbi:hypothetical protein SEPCBS119000_006682 [Sporothrix epigloea]|uniref:Uncharacterized protein n=1 Tax=Sporothrix epigloea TaxID=1892477 RepID=A0ABP0E7H5_9PEZI
MSDNDGKATLTAIPVLENSTQWFPWIKKVTIYLKMHGYDDLLHRDKDQPELEPGERQQAYSKRLREWEKLQVKACACVSDRLGVSASGLIEDDPENVGRRLDKLRARYQPQGATVYNNLFRRYVFMRLSSCTGVNDYAQKLRQAREEIQGIDKSITICDSMFLQQFVIGLGPEYGTFLSAFQQNHSLYPIRDVNNPDIITKPAITFEALVMLVEREEQLQKQNVTEVEELAFLTKTVPDNKRRQTNEAMAYSIPDAAAAAYSIPDFHAD